jgi:HK97 family phage prohead protease
MAIKVFAVSSKAVKPPQPKAAPAADERVGRSVSFMSGQTKLVGVVASVADGKALVNIGLPIDGKIAVTGCEIEVDACALAITDTPHESRRVELANRRQCLDTDAKGVAVKDDKTGQVVDYQDVTFAGYASTWAHITPSDRQGDNVQVGAFRSTIRDFMANPVMLIDHRMSVENIAGHYTIVREDDRGLFVQGQVSNSPHMKHARFALMEKSLRTLSIGGIWVYEPDGRTISKAYLFEISLVAVPANPDAIIQARSLDLAALTRISQ